MRIFLMIFSVSFVVFLLVVIFNSPVLMMVIASSLPFGAEPAPICSLEVLESRNGLHRIRYIYSVRATGAHTSDIWVKDLKDFTEESSGCTWLLRESCDFVGDNRLQYFNENGKLIEDSYYRDDKLDGPYKRWYDSGTLKNEAYYENGQCVGTRKEYSENGLLKSQWECNPSNKGSFTYDSFGELESETFTILDDGDKVIITEKYREDGTKYRDFRRFVNRKVARAFQPDVTVNARTSYDHFISDGIKSNAEWCWRRDKSLEEIENQSIIFPNSYEYYTTIGADSDLRVFLPAKGSYFYYQNEDRIAATDHPLQKAFSFPEAGYFVDGYWENRGPVTTGISLTDLPDGFFLQWYEPLKQQYWEIDYRFSKDLFEKFKQHCFRNLKHGGQRCLLQPYNAFSFKVDILQEGRVNLYLGAGGETYLLGELQGSPKLIKDSFKPKSFKKQYQRLVDHWSRISQEIPEEQIAMLNDRNSQRKQAMRKFRWKIVGSELYKIKGSYYVEFVNGETYHLDEMGRNFLQELSAAPKELIVYVEGASDSPTPRAIERIRFKFGDDIVEIFEDFAGENGEPIELVISMLSNFKKFRMHLTDGKKEVRLTPIFSTLETIPKEYQSILEKDESDVEE